ncbi:MAG: hypothetical protein ABSH07_10735 [Candidatus Dormibacteria bacterium]
MARPQSGQETQAPPRRHEDELTRRIDATCDEAPRDDLTAVARADLIDTGAWEW